MATVNRVIRIVAILLICCRPATTQQERGGEVDGNLGHPPSERLSSDELKAEKSDAEPPAQNTAEPPQAHEATHYSCDEYADRARKHVEDQWSRTSCTAPKDCIVIDFRTNCFDSCTRAIHKNDVDNARKIMDEANEKWCDAFAKDGCKVTHPPCKPPAEPQCVEGRCK